MFVEITDYSGRKCRIDYPDTTLDRNYFVTGMQKSGSVLLNNIVRAICQALHYPSVPIASRFYEDGVRPIDVSLAQYHEMDRLGYVYTATRDMYIPERIPSYVASKKILLVRDPRDVAVSKFFSDLYSHLPPGGGQEAATFNHRRSSLANHTVNSAITSGMFDGLFGAQSKACTHRLLLPSMTIFRYEDVVFDKKRWVADLTQWLDGHLSDEIQSSIAAQFDIIPGEEKPYDHIRQVHPGNYKKHLTSESISYIEERSRPFREVFGYS